MSCEGQGEAFLIAWGMGGLVLVLLLLFLRQRYALRLMRVQQASELKLWQERIARLPELQEGLARAEQALQEARRSLADQAQRLTRQEVLTQAEHEQRLHWQEEGRRWSQQYAESERARQNLAQELVQVRTQAQAEQQQQAEKLAWLQQARDELSQQFQHLAQKILDEKSERVQEQQQTQLQQLLQPFKERLLEFRSKVEELHRHEVEQQALLRGELGQLMALNRQMSEEAHGLATALKGQSKMQGNWGELVLENVLERSGLRRGLDFQQEVSFNTEEGRRRPDVVVLLPQNKHLIIDAKVSLNAYTRYINAEDEVVRQTALNEHVQAVRARIQELADRNYFALPGVRTPEMVFMFVPIESAFSEAMRAEPSLFERSIEQKVLMATPTTLLTSLNIVRQLWRFEEQNVHSAELAERAAKLYKKLAGFLEGMQVLGQQIDRAKESYDKAMNQFCQGRGNLIHQAKDFERLGVAVQASLPEDLVAKAALELNWEDEPGE